MTEQDRIDRTWADAAIGRSFSEGMKPYIEQARARVDEVARIAAMTHLSKNERNRLITKVYA